jgi:hypothetical protein
MQFSVQFPCQHLHVLDHWYNLLEIRGEKLPRDGTHPNLSYLETEAELRGHPGQSEETLGNPISR